MNVRLLYPNKDFKLITDYNENQTDLVDDLELELIFKAAAGYNKHNYSVFKSVILDINTDIEVIKYRQEVFGDFLRNYDLMQEINKFVTSTLQALRASFFGVIDSTINSKYFSAAGLVEYMIPALAQIRDSILPNRDSFKSRGIQELIKIFDTELADKKIESLKFTFDKLQFKPGVLVRCHFVNGTEIGGFDLMQYEENPDNDKRWRKAKKYEVNFLDQNSHREYIRKMDLSLNSIVNSVVKICNTFYNFFNQLYEEFAFYIASVNLYKVFSNKGISVTYPEPCAPEDKIFDVDNLVELGLALNDHIVIGNTLCESNKPLFLVTGANQGGKSTFLRSTGQSFLLMQAGLFVPAKKFKVSVVEGIYTHFGREEDESLQSGRLDEELSRMSRIINSITPNSLMLFNESFVSTNEREGALIASQIIDALTSEGVWVIFITHMYELYLKLTSKKRDDVYYLRASRDRTFKLVEGEPLSTSFAMDIYQDIFMESDSVESKWNI